MKLKFIQMLALIYFTTGTLYAQSDLGNSRNQRSGVHSGNRVKTVFQNAGVVGFPSNGGPRGAWKYENNGYIGDVSFMVGAEVKMTSATNKTHPTVAGLITSNGGEVFHSVVVSDVPRPSTGGQDKSAADEIWAFEPKPGYFNSAQQSIAFSDKKNTWPASWPDKENDANDPGWRGSWNGYFGKEPKADQESYYVMDDHADFEFNINPFNHKPDSRRPERKGLGLDVKVRGMQWSQFLAQDCIFWLYEVKNNSTTDYDKAVVGLLAGTLVGVTGNDNYGEFDDDVSFFDVLNSLVYTWDFDNNVSRNPRWVTTEVGYVGYAFLESPGNGYDGIDNDRDALTSGAKLFTDSSFVPTKIKAGDTLIVIADNFSRSRFIVPNSGSFKLKTRGMLDSVTIILNQTVLVEGNSVITDSTTTNGIKQYIYGPNSNSFDFVDNDFDGLIDENYFVHYRQKKTTIKNNVETILFDIIAPTVYINYKTDSGNEYKLIDERRDDGIDNDGDWDASLDDVGKDGVANSGDLADGEDDGIPSDGEPNFEATDVSESDQIGLTSFNYFTPSGEISLIDDERLWKELKPGFFSVPENFVNGVPINGEDGDFTFGSGYFPLLADKTEFFSFALVYGKNKNDLYNHRKTVQKIYDSNYLFPQAPNKPIVKAVAGDSKVTLYWDRGAEETIDPVLKFKDFEGYKVYRSRDNNFNDINTITNAYGEKIGYEPLIVNDVPAIYDIPKNNIYGLFIPSGEVLTEARGYVYYLGDDNVGLKHSIVDNSVTNGVRYFYAVVAYDRGDVGQGIFPSENTKVIDSFSDGSFGTDVNTIVITPEARAGDYLSESTFPLTKVGPANGSVSVTVVDDTKLKDNNVYEISFFDTSNDGIDNDGDLKIDKQDIDEIRPITTSYNVKSITDQTELLNGGDLGGIQLLNYGSFIDQHEVVIKDKNGVVIDTSKYVVDEKRGRIRPKNGYSFNSNEMFSFTYKPYGIYKSIYIPGNDKAVNDPSEDVIYDGIKINMTNYWQILVIADSSVFYGEPTSFVMSANRQNQQLGGMSLQGLNVPYNYEMEFFDSIVDTSIAGSQISTVLATSSRQARGVRFKIKNTTLNRYADFVYFTLTARYTKWGGRLARTDELIILEPIDTTYNSGNIIYNSVGKVNGKFQAMTYKLLLLSSNTAIGDTAIFGTNLKYKLVNQKPFASMDKFYFTSKSGSSIPAAFNNQLLNDVQVVPNPYVGFSSLENPLPPLISSGRGERRIEFRNVPANSKVHLFTTSGTHIRTLNDDGSSFTGTYRWDLRTKENLDIAAGIYFYVIESPVGTKEGKLAIIK